MKKKGDKVELQINPNGQSAMLQRIMRQTYVSVIIGIVLLAVFVGLNITSNNSMKEQVQNVTVPQPVSAGF